MSTRGTSPRSRRLPAAWAGILVLAGLILIVARVRPTFIYLMFVVMLAGAVGTSLTGLLGRERQWRWQVVAGLLGILPAVGLAVCLIVLYPTGSDHGLLTVTVGLLVLAWMMSTVLNLLSWKSIVNAVLGAVQWCAPGHRRGDDEATVDLPDGLQGHSVQRSVGDRGGRIYCRRLAVLATLIATRSRYQ